MASGSKPSRKITSKKTKGKSPATASEPTSRPLPSIEDALNQTRFFSQRDQMIRYGSEFYHRVNGVWQHGRVNQDHGENAEDEDQPMPKEHVADIGQQSSVQYDPQMLS
ncbi:hypothetical protein Fmac_001389 [Flemingia macrophylla]|uniref:Uncharacterized protein n=1 Tax=Flemingia macrophylla TaxID=520843 RepID=A0ABD1NGZ9_9FABA